jgi:predicted P-loop ATPase
MNPQAIEIYLNNRYEFKYNEIKNSLKFKARGVGAFQEMKDYEVNSFLRELKRNGFPKIQKIQLLEIFHSDFTQTYNPFIEYFEGLPPLETDCPDYIQQLAETVSVSEEERAHWYSWFKKWLVGVVACAVNDSKINQTCLIFVGAQGLGKTSWLMKLAPPCLIDYTYSGSINPGNKDSEIQLAENILINLDELENLGNKNINALKEIITKPQVKIRRPYASRSENMPRRASFMGSVNNMEFLRDPTGTRRFLCFNTEQINYLHTVDIDKVYKQAYKLYQNGFLYYFNEEERKQINEHNEKYKRVSIEEEVLEGLFEIPTGTDTPEIELPTERLIEYINANCSFAPRLSIRNLGIALTNKNWPKKKIHGIRHWQLKRKRVAA